MPGLEEGQIAALIAAHAGELGGGRGGVQLRWSNRPRPGVWLSSVQIKDKKYVTARGSTPLRALVSLEIALQLHAREGRKRGSGKADRGTEG